MAETHLKDMIIPEVFDNYVRNNSLKTNNLINSGIVQKDDWLGDQLSQPGTRITIPYINDLAGSPDNWTDDSDIQVNNLTSGSQVGMKFYQAKAFGQTDLSTLMTGAPVQDQIASRFSFFWNTSDQAMLFSILKGMFQNDDIANSKVLDLTAQSPTDSEFSAKGFIAALSLMGDQPENILSSIAVNSATYAMMKSQNLIETIQPSNGGQAINVYNGKQVVVDDDIPTEGTTKDNTTSVAYLFGTGAVSYSTQMFGTKVVDEPLKQGGRESVLQKRIGCIHPLGMSVNPQWNPTKPNFPTPDDFSQKEAWIVPKGMDVKHVQLVQYKFKLDPYFVLTKKAQSTVQKVQEASDTSNNGVQSNNNGDATEDKNGTDNSKGTNK